MHANSPSKEIAIKNVPPHSRAILQEKSQYKIAVFSLRAELSALDSETGFHVGNAGQIGVRRSPDCEHRAEDSLAFSRIHSLTAFSSVEASKASPDDRRGGRHKPLRVLFLRKVGSQFKSVSRDSGGKGAVPDACIWGNATNIPNTCNTDVVVFESVMVIRHVCSAVVGG